MPRQVLRRQPADLAEPTPQAPRRRPGHATTAAPAHGAARHPQPQFQTPPSREPPPAAEPARRHSPASAQAAIFSLFGRGVRGRPRGVMMDEDDGEDDDLAGGLHEVGPDEDVEEGLEDEEEEDEEEVIDEEDLEPEAEGEVEVEVEDEDEAMQDHEDEKSPSPSPSPPLPPNLREITNLASWTVSTHKPGFGVPALRSSSPTQYWQSDGPQPHTLTLHFFKLVAIVRIRVYLNFDLDESYTPTKLMFLAGMGGNDLVEFAAWEGDAP
ncbi:complex subunit 10, partial [Aspergillus sp. HF37]